MRQKVDSYAVTTRNFSALLNKARGNLKMREDYLISSISGGHSVLPPSSDYMHGQPSKPRSATISDLLPGSIVLYKVVEPLLLTDSY